MKKIYLASLLVFSSLSVLQAQQSKGGFPLSFQSQQLQKQQVPLLQFSSPDFTSILKKELQDQIKGVAKPYMVSTFVASNISLENSGTIEYLKDGSKVWRLAIQIPGSKAISLYYDRFALPEGVRYFLTNQNKRQILGAYTASNNTKYQNFVTEPVQGDYVYLEMNISAGVSLSAIQFHVDKLSAYYRGVDDLNEFAEEQSGAVVLRPTDDMPGTSPCHINAMCPIPNIPLTRYEKERAASVKITALSQDGAGFCSGTLINNTGNNKNGTCQPLLLTASHCDGSNSYSSQDFSQWMFKFNYQYADCDGPTKVSPSPTYDGAAFKSRSYYPSFNTGTSGNSSMVSDFLLLELNSLPAATNTYLAGWNRNLDIAAEFNQDYYNFFIGFHHPNGDIKKKSWGIFIAGNGTFNQNVVSATHWNMTFTNGGTQPGSSGSGLFDVDGLLIGDLSGGQSANPSCGPTYGSSGLYSKLSYGWENDFDQTNFPAHAGAQSQLKPWLDPANTNVSKLGPTKVDCSDMPNVSIHSLQEQLNKSINIYPNPSKTGLIHSQFNFVKNQTIQVSVYNTLGKLQKVFHVADVLSQDYQFDCSDLADGIYMMRFDIDNYQVSKKFIIAK